MTVVLARKFGQTIQLVSDTMITDAERGRADALPGRVKAIVIHRTLSIAFAGHADPALRVIRQVARSGPCDLDLVYQTLCQATASRDHDVEFLVASHRPEASLRRIWRGQVSAPLAHAAIGDATIRPAVYERLVAEGVDAKDAHAFRSAFLMAFTNERIPRGDGVGGFPIAVEASPDGHRYRGHSVHMSWKPITFVPGTTYQDPADLQTGDWSFHHTVMHTEERGVAVVAAQIPQARVGFVYAPLLQDEPRRVTLLRPGVDWTEHQEEMFAVLRDALNATADEARPLGWPASA